MLVLALGNMTRPDAVDVLLSFLDDDDLVGHAVMALGEIGDPRARGGIEPQLSHPKKWVQTQARRALKKLK